MENENDYLEAVNDMKKQYEEKEREYFFRRENIRLGSKPFAIKSPSN